VSGFAAPSRGGLVATTLARVEEWLLDPVEQADAIPAAPPAQPPIVAVVPLAPRCGGTTVARGLAATFAARATLGAAIVCGPSGSVALALSTAGATRLARAVGDFVDAPHRVSGRLCLVEGDARIARAAALRNQAALVVEVPHGDDASEAAALADVTVLVASGRTEPSLAAVVGASLARSGPEPIVVTSRTGLDDDPWPDSAAIGMPDARLASRIALAGREPPGALGAALTELADRCERALP
jgi:hypothetical protein